MKHIIQRTRIIEPDKSYLQMHRNTRIDNHTIDFLSELDNNLLHRYPVINDFISKYSKFLNVGENNILLTSGVDGAIRHIFETFLNKTSKIMLLEPTYAMYRVYSSAYNNNILSILPNKNTFYIDADKILRNIQKVKCVFLPNPNAPIENTFDINILKNIAEKCDKYNKILFIDEAYYGFGSETFIPYVNDYKNVFIARSFSKWFGLPSIRLGCIISNKKNIEIIESRRLAYETNRLSINVANVALNNIPYFTHYAKEINTSRQILKKEMCNLNIKTHGNVSNNILINTKLNFENEKILIRKNIPFPAENWISLTLGSVHNINYFLNVFKRLNNE